jgi:hypothetical protein
VYHRSVLPFLAPLRPTNIVFRGPRLAQPPGAAAAGQRGGPSPTIVNLTILGAGLLVGVAAYQFRDTPIGATFLGAAGSMTAVALVLFMRDLWLPETRIMEG